MLGPDKSAEFNAEYSGVIPRAAVFFFHAIEHFKNIEKGTLKVSFMETYLGGIRDLNPVPGLHPDLKIRMKKGGGTKVEGLYVIYTLNILSVYPPLCILSVYPLRTSILKPLPT